MFLNRYNSIYTRMYTDVSSAKLILKKLAFEIIGLNYGLFYTYTQKIYYSALYIL